VILFELATGKVPFDATHYMAVLAKHLSEPPPPFDSLRSPVELPADFEAIVQRCLAKRPDQRFQTMLEVMAATDRLSQRLHARPTPVGHGQPAVPEVVPPLPGSNRALAAREPHLDARRGSGNSLPAAADRSVVAPPRSRGLSLVLSALALSALGISLWRMQSPEPLGGAGTPRAAATSFERLSEAPTLPSTRAQAPAASPSSSQPATDEAGTPAPAPGSHGAGSGGATPSALPPGAAAEPLAPGQPTSGVPAVGGSAPLTVVELAPGKSVEIEARTRLSLRLTRDAEAKRRAPSAAAPAPRKSSDAARSAPQPERPSDGREPSGLMNPWPTPAIGPAHQN
jgi:hypothetical protein